MKKLVVFGTEYRELDNMLMSTMSGENCECKMYYLQDTPFLPDNAMSIYEYYLSRYEDCKPQKKDLYYVFIDVPEFWEIQADGLYGKVLNHGEKKASIYFREPIIARLVERVEWHDENGHVFRIDYYNRYGWVYCSAYTNDAGAVIAKSYYNSQRMEFININYSNGIVTTFEDGKVKMMYESVEKFQQFVIQEIIAETDVVVSAGEKQLEMVGTYAKAADKTYIMVAQSAEEQDYFRHMIESQPMCGKLLVLSNYDTKYRQADRGRMEYKVPYSREQYPVIGENRDVFVLTSSDQINSLEKLIEELPQLRFHIAAKTMVSDKLKSLGEIDNVYVYEGINAETTERLLNCCDYYLDTNYGMEVDNIIAKAAFHNLLILGYREQCHNADYVVDTGMFAADEEEGLIELFRSLSNSPEAWTEMIVEQQEKARRVIRIIME